MRCFEYALESILNPVAKHSDRPSNYDITKYNQLGMSYPVDITDVNIEKYETFLNASINIYIPSNMMKKMIVMKYILCILVITLILKNGNTSTFLL